MGRRRAKHRLLDDLVDREAGDARIDGFDVDFFRIFERRRDVVAESSLDFRVDDPRKLGEMFWDSIAARVNVVIESQMTIHPDSAEWVACFVTT